jgi:hypothetical protein
MGRLRKFAQNKVRSADRRVSFPVTIRHRNAKVKINAPGKHFPHYLLACTVPGKRRMHTFHAARDAASRCWRLFLSLPQRRASSAGAQWPKPVPNTVRKIPTATSFDVPGCSKG